MLKVMQILFEVGSILGSMILWCINSLTQRLFSYSIMTDNHTINFLVFVVFLLLVMHIGKRKD
jgi:hypothetical protein